MAALAFIFDAFCWELEVEKRAALRGTDHFIPDSSSSSFAVIFVEASGSR